MRMRAPALTIRARLTLTYAGLFTLGGGALVLALTTAFYRLIFQPLPDNAIPSVLDPDHDHFIGLSDQIRDAAASHLLRIAMVLLLLVVAVSALVGWWVAGRMLRPIAAITAAARRANDTNLHERLDLPGPPDELKELGDTFDRMLERLDASFATQRRFVANASHELRTPLALTRTAVEVTLAKPTATEAQWRTMAADVAESTGRAQRLIDALLTLARSEQGVTDPQDDDLADLAAEALDRIAVRCRERDLRLEVELAPTPVRGNLTLLGSAVANLLENAVTYNRDGGLLRVVTAYGADTATDGESGGSGGSGGSGPGGNGGGDWVELTVSNDGPEIPADSVAELFEPFHRGRDTRRSDGAGDGTGLGLSIVRAVARAHGGRAEAVSRPGGGLTVTLRLQGR
ncbi:sensor histidine kinase [Streptacidiphilus cavernicola]|uniref:histidine kinase n=1 Tax=Streptacidiphilus cavernicola TaxID=3342716 RepID=A0ABV6VWE9_9ACTN